MRLAGKLHVRLAPKENLMARLQRQSLSDLKIVPTGQQSKRLAEPPKNFILYFSGLAGDPGRTRPYNLLLRRQLLYPVELRGRYAAGSGAQAGPI